MATPGTPPETATILSPTTSSPIDPSEALLNSQPSIPFQGPVKTTADLKHALETTLGLEKGGEMFDKFITSILTMAFGTMHKEMARSQQAARQMRRVYKENT